MAPIKGVSGCWHLQCVGKLMRAFDLVRVWKKWVFNILSSVNTDISGGESTVLCGELLQTTGQRKYRIRPN